MTFLEIKRAVYRRVKLSDTPAAADVSRIAEFVNLRYRELLASAGIERCRDTTLTFATVASQRKYGLPQAISRIRSVFDLTNQRRIFPRSLDYLRNTDPGLTATASFIEFWIPLNGWGAVRVELASTGVPLYVESTSAGDTQLAYVETTRLGGVRALTTSHAVTGTTRVQLGTLSDHIEVVKFYLATVAVGTVSLYDAAVGGNILAQITPGREVSRYFMLQLHPTPGAAVTLYVDCQRSIEDMVNDTEEPLFHEDFHHCLVDLAEASEWRNRDDNRADKAEQSGQRTVNQLRHYMTTTADEINVQRGPYALAERISRLGGYFPAGT